MNIVNLLHINHKARNRILTWLPCLGLTFLSQPKGNLTLGQLQVFLSWKIILLLLVESFNINCSRVLLLYAPVTWVGLSIWGQWLSESFFHLFKFNNIFKLFYWNCLILKVSLIFLKLENIEENKWGAPRR